MRGCASDLLFKICATNVLAFTRNARTIQFMGCTLLPYRASGQQGQEQKMSIKLENLGVNEIKFNDGSGQPANRGNFRSGWWTVECRGIKYRVYASIPCNYDYSEMRTDLIEKFHNSLSNGGKVELANHPNR